MIYPFVLTACTIISLILLGYFVRHLPLRFVLLIFAGMFNSWLAGITIGQLFF